VRQEVHLGQENESNLIEVSLVAPFRTGLEWVVAQTVQSRQRQVHRSILQTFLMIERLQSEANGRVAA